MARLHLEPGRTELSQLGPIVPFYLNVWPGTDPGSMSLAEEKDLTGFLSRLQRLHVYCPSATAAAGVGVWAANHRSP